MLTPHTLNVTYNIQYYTITQLHRVLLQRSLVLHRSQWRCSALCTPPSPETKDMTWKDKTLLQFVGGNVKNKYQRQRQIYQ